MTQQIEDFNLINQEIFYEKFEKLKSSGTFLFKDVTLYDPVLSQIINACLDYILRFKRDFLKTLTPAQAKSVI